MKDYWKSLAGAAGGLVRAALPPLFGRPSAETGSRTASDEALRRLMRDFGAVPELREKILLLREMEERDGRVKAIHGRVARDTVRGGLVMLFEQSAAQSLRREWAAFSHGLQLHNAQKLRSDARGLITEGNLPLQLVLDEAGERVVAAVRMPAETIVPVVDATGRFKNPARAYEQRDMLTGQAMAAWPAWQLQLGRFDPRNFDDLGEMGRPFLSACVTTWRKLMRTEEDLVVRRHMRAPLRLAHVLEGASDAELDRYRNETDGVKGDPTTDFYLNRKGGVTALQGDATLGDIGDVVHLLDTFFAGTPAPKGLFGYVDGLARDVLEDLKRDYYDEVDHLQDTLAWEYEWCFRIHMLFRGVVLGPDEISLRFAERRTETPNQVADLALKLQALGLPPPLVWEEMGYEPKRILDAVDAWAERADPYPPLPDGSPGGTGGPGASATPTGAPAPRVAVTPGNARKGQSATSISVAGTNNGRGRGG
jgi:hypothetical protein